MRAQSLGAEPDVELCGLARARPGQGVADSLVRFDPAPLPQRQLREEDVEDPLTAVFAERAERGVEVSSGSLEVPTSELQVGAEHEEHVREVRRDGPDRRRARAVGLVPRADRELRLDGVRDEHGAVDPERAERLEPALARRRRLARPSQHHQHVGERDVRLEQVLDMAGLLGELEHPRETLEALP